MSDLRVKVTKSFPGVEDGQIYPRTIQEGDVITGDLAAVALREKWGVKEKDEKPAVTTVKAAATTAKTQQTDPKAADADKDKDKDLLTDADKNPAVEIPADWKALKLPELKELAEKIKGSVVADAAEAKTVIEAELARREAQPKA